MSLYYKMIAANTGHIGQKPPTRSRPDRQSSTKGTSMKAHALEYVTVRAARVFYARFT